MTKSSEWAEAAVVAGKEVPPLPRHRTRRWGVGGHRESGPCLRRSDDGGPLRHLLGVMVEAEKKEAKKRRRLIMAQAVAEEEGEVTRVPLHFLQSPVCSAPMKHLVLSTPVSTAGEGEEREDVTRSRGEYSCTWRLRSTFPSHLVPFFLK